MTPAKLRDKASSLPNPSGGVLAGLAYDQDWRFVHRYKQTNNDGHEVEVYCVRMPAIFYRIVCRDHRLDLLTGSSAEDLTHRIATALAAGMLGNRLKGHA